MTVRLFRVIMPVSDIEEAARFYGAVLQQGGERVSGGRHYFDCDGIILACLEAAADGDAVNLAARSEHVYFAVADLERTRERCVEARAALESGDVHGEPAGEIVTRPWGERSFYARDPFGNPICFVDDTTLFTGSARIPRTPR